MRTGLTIIMMMFFASLTLDLAMPTAILLSLLVLERTSGLLKRGLTGERRLIGEGRLA